MVYWQDHFVEVAGVKTFAEGFISFLGITGLLTHSDGLVSGVMTPWLTIS